MTNVNWLGTLYTIQPALGQMAERGSGSVVIVSSGAGLRAFPQASVYGATKAAQLVFALPARPLAERIVKAVEAGAAEVYYPGSIKALRVFQGASPTLADRILRLMRGKAAAPRRS